MEFVDALWHVLDEIAYFVSCIVHGKAILIVAKVEGFFSYVLLPADSCSEDDWID